MKFEFADVVTFSNVTLIKSTVVEPEDRDKSTLKVELLFSGSRLQQSDALIVSSKDLIYLSRFLGEKAFIKFKIDEQSWRRCLDLGIKVGGESTWDVSPQVWRLFDSKSKESDLGIWYRPVRLVSLGTNLIDYQIIKPSARKAKPNAFDYFSQPQSTDVDIYDWRSNLEGMDSQINRELQEIGE
jgi:hypothetical protein